MYPYLGDFPTGKTIFFPFHSFQADGASVTISGLALGDILVYKNASMTQRASTAGFALVDTDGIDIDAIQGIHGITIDTSDNTDAGFFAAGNDYTVVISTITVDAKTVSFILGRFSIENRSITANVTKWLGTDCPTPHTAGYPIATVKDGTGTGELDTDAGKVTLADGAISGPVFTSGAISNAALATSAAQEIAAEVWAAVIEAQGSVTAANAMSYMLAVLTGQTTVAGATYTVKTHNGGATRVTYTLNASKERTAVTLNAA